MSLSGPQPRSISKTRFFNRSSDRGDSACAATRFAGIPEVTLRHPPFEQEQPSRPPAVGKVHRAITTVLVASVRPLHPRGGSEVDATGESARARPGVEHSVAPAGRSNGRRRSGRALAQAPRPRRLANAAPGTRHTKRQSSIAAPD